MTARNTIKISSLVITLSYLFCSCEGFKVLTVCNRTGQEITIQTKPELPVFRHTLIPDTTQILSDTKEYKIPADSSLTLLATFGGLLFNNKIKEQDLATDYLKIITAKDTIIANNRKEILSLAKNQKTKYNRKTDKTFAWDDNKNIEVIIIRQ